MKVHVFTFLWAPDNNPFRKRQLHLVLRLGLTYAIPNLSHSTLSCASPSFNLLQLLWLFHDPSSADVFLWVSSCLWYLFEYRLCPSLRVIYPAHHHFKVFIPPMVSHLVNHCIYSALFCLFLYIKHLCAVLSLCIALLFMAVFHKKTWGLAVLTCPNTCFFRNTPVSE